MQQHVQAIFLDAGNTLFVERRPRTEMYAEVAREFGSEATAEHVERSFSMRMKELPASIDGAYRFSTDWFRAFHDLLFQDLGVPGGRTGDAHERMVEVFEDPANFQVFEEVPEVLADLADRDLILGVVSNWSERLPRLLQALGIAEPFDFIVTSAELRAEKPDRSIFERALFRAGRRASETLHAGDHFERDVRGALNAGLRAALVERNGDPARKRSSEREGVPVLRDLRPLLALAAPASHASSS